MPRFQVGDRVWKNALSPGAQRIRSGSAAISDDGCIDEVESNVSGRPVGQSQSLSLSFLCSSRRFRGASKNSSSFNFVTKGWLPVESELEPVT